MAKHWPLVLRRQFHTFVCFTNIFQPAETRWWWNPSAGASLCSTVLSLLTGRCCSWRLQDSVRSSGSWGIEQHPRARWWSPLRHAGHPVSPPSPAERGLGSALQLDGESHIGSEPDHIFPTHTNNTSTFSAVLGVFFTSPALTGRLFSSSSSVLLASQSWNSFQRTCKYQWSLEIYQRLLLGVKHSSSISRTTVCVGAGGRGRINALYTDRGQRSPHAD